MSHIKVKADGHVLEIKVDRAEKYNALSPEMYIDLCRALGQLDRSPELRVGLIHAEGKHFSAGIELDKWASYFNGGAGFPTPEDGLDLFGVQGARCRKPLVMALQGYSYTWAVESMLNTDVRVAAEDTKFGMLEVQRGIFPCGGATLRLPAQMGWSNAMRYLLTGDVWTAAEAYRTGLVQQVVAPGEQYAAARAIADKIAAGAPLGVAAILKSSRLTQEKGEAAAAGEMFKDLAAIMGSEDAKEGILSFVERRAGVFKGR